MTECDYNNPESVLPAFFFLEMNIWEFENLYYLHELCYIVGKHL